MMNDRLVLGTVQLGMSYGINNKSGKPDFGSACEIVKAALDCGVTRFDTAQAYGDSEEVLGRVFDKLKAGMHVKVYSKLHPGLDLRDGMVIRHSVEDSLLKLKVDRLEGLLLHHEDGLRFWDEGLGDVLRKLAAQGKVKSVGASFYTPAKASAGVDIDGLDIFQIPSNILDHRFEDAGFFKKAQKQGKEVFVRSVFLQGLLLMHLDRVPPAMKYAQPYLERLEQLAADMRLSRQELAMGYVAQRWPKSFVLFGAENRLQVIDNVRVFSLNSRAKIDEGVFDNVPEDVLNPMLWPKL